MDDLVGKTMAKCRDKHTLLMVISDHGFGPFRRGVDLNRWLEENGYLTLHDGRRDEEHLAGVDWSRTRAFAIGLAGIYINIKDKYSQGIVEPGGEADRLREEISERLTALVDPENGASAVKRVYIASKFYKGPYRENGPDLIVGYQRGYRVSWETAIGRTTEGVFHANTKAWSGDHCVDPSLVPGILFCNRRVENENPRLIDIGPTVLSMFGAAVPEYMDGKVLDGGRGRREGPERTRRGPGTGGLMADASAPKVNRRTLLKGSAAVAAAVAAAGGWAWGTTGSGRGSHVSRSLGKKVIVIGVDGMDPRLSESMMKAGLLPNLEKLRASGGFSSLGTSTPPQSPVAWANFINGAGPGSHGIFDFIHRHPQEQCAPFYSAAETVPGEGSWEVGDHRLQLDFWPFNHKPPATVLRRQGTPFWDYLDAAGIPSTFYDLPSNYPASPSHYGHHRCICGMGTPDMLGTYGTYQYFAEDAPTEPLDEGGGKRSKLTFEDETARARLVGPENSLLKKPAPITIELLVHRDRDANAAVIEIQGQRILLEARPVEPLDEARLQALGALRSCRRRASAGSAGSSSRRSRRISGSTSRRSTWTRPPPRRRSPSRTRSSRTSPSGSGRSTPRASRKTTRRDRTASSPTTSSPGRRAWSWKSGSRCSTTPSTTTTTACCSSTSPAATSSRTSSGGTPTTSTRSVPSSRPRRSSATSGGSTRSSTP